MKPTSRETASLSKDPHSLEGIKDFHLGAYSQSRWPSGLEDDKEAEEEEGKEEEEKRKKWADKKGMEKKRNKRRGREKEREKENNLGKGCIGSRYIGYGESCKMEMLWSYLIDMYEILKNTENYF